MSRLKHKRNFSKNKTLTKEQLMLQDAIDQPIPPLKKLPWEQVEQIYKKKLKGVDKNIHEVFDFVKPQANSIYFDRKVELQSIVDNKKIAEEYKMKRINKELERQYELENFDKGIENLKKIMVKYDIKHPLRGDEYAEMKQNKQPFAHKILGIVAANNSYFEYKKDLRQALDFSEIRSLEYKKQEALRFQKQRTIMKYRIYGSEGVTEREQDRLKEWGVIKPLQQYKKVKVKKRVFKWRKDSRGFKTQYSTDDSRSCDSAYTYQQQQVYQSNEDGNPIEVNMGFEIMPLCPTMYGKAAARRSNIRHNQKVSSLVTSDRFSTIQPSQTLHQRRVSKTRNQIDRSPMQIPKLKATVNSSYDYGIKLSHGSLNSLPSRNDVMKNLSKTRKIVVPVQSFEHNSTSDLYQGNNDLNLIGETEQSQLIGKSKFVNMKHMNTVTSRLMKTEMERQNLTYKSTTVTPRMATQMANYGKPLQTNIERKAMGDGRMNKMFSDRTPKLSDGDIKSLVSKYPLAEKKEIQEEKVSDNILAKISHTDTYKQFYEKSKAFSAPRKSQGGINKQNNLKIKQQLEFLGHNIDKMQEQSQKYYRELMAKVVLQNFRDEEIMKIQEFFKEFEFAEPETIPGLFDLKMRDEEERLKVMKEVTKDHHSGKLDPGKMVNKVKKKPRN